MWLEKSSEVTNGMTMKYFVDAIVDKEIVKYDFSNNNCQDLALRLYKGVLNGKPSHYARYPNCLLGIIPVLGTKTD